jgi:hypothetical protein
VVLALVFGVSLLTFHYAPHHLLPPRQKYSIPGVQRLPIFQKNGPLHRHPMAKVEEARVKQQQQQEEKAAQTDKSEL